MLESRHELLAGTDYDHTNFKSGPEFDGFPVGSLDLGEPSYTLVFGKPLAIGAQRASAAKPTRYGSSPRPSRLSPTTPTLMRR